MRLLAVFGALVASVLVAVVIGLVLDARYDWRYSVRETAGWFVFVSLLWAAGIVKVQIEGWLE